MRHKTWQAADSVGGAVTVGCENCDWSDRVKVLGLSWVDAMGKIIESRHLHELSEERRVQRLER